MVNHRNVDVSARSAVAIVSLIVLGFAGSMLVVEWADVRAAEFRQVCATLAVIAAGTCGLAIVSGLVAATGTAARIVLLRQVGAGVALVTAAAGVWAVAATLLGPRFRGFAEVLIPSGLFAGGLARIATALND